MISVKNLRKSFHGTEVLKGISAEIQRGDVVCIIGPSGSGKSTFLRCLNRLETPDSGEILLDGVDLMDRKPTWTASGGRWAWSSSSSTSSPT